MKNDLDSIMQANQIDAILATGPGDHNPAVVYLTGGGNLTNADVLKLSGQAPILFHSDIERDEAARTGLRTVNLASYPMEEMRKAVNGDFLKLAVLRYQSMFAEAGLQNGRVALYGRMEAGAALAIFSGLQDVMPGLSFVSELGNTILMEAMATKDADEVARIRGMGKITTQVVGRVADFLTNQRSKDGVLVQADGQPVTIGEVKKRINLWLAEAGAENPEGTDLRDWL